MKPSYRLLVVAAALPLAGCAVNPPLLFGDDVTFGLGVSNDAATSGAAVSLGYKHRSIAVVPVSILDGDGTVATLKGHGDQGKDALSVFAVFESSAAGTPAKADQAVRLGQVFSTGLAAQALTRGYECRHAGTNCAAKTPATPVTPVTPVTAAANPALPAPAAPAAQVAFAAKNEKTAAEPTTRPYQSPLVFLRSDVFGFDIGGSAADKGAQFAIGMSSRNLALIPVAVYDGSGKAWRLVGDSGISGGSTDAFSVLGQFKSTTQTARLDFGLERYFATGVAATNLGRGLGAAIANDTSTDPAQPAGGQALAAPVQTAVRP